MKFSFKIQQYQTDAVDAVVRVFQGQPYHAGVSYLRDIGTSQGISGQLSLLTPEENGGQTELQDLMNDSGFKNEAIRMRAAFINQPGLSLRWGGARWISRWKPAQVKLMFTSKRCSR